MQGCIIALKRDNTVDTGCYSSSFNPERIMLTSVLESTGICTWIVASIVGLLTLLYLYLTWNFNYWEKKGIKCNKPRVIWGTMSNPMKVPQDVQDMECYKKFGKIYGIYEGRTPALHIADPAILKHIFVKDFASFQNRRILKLSESDFVRKFLSVMKGEEWKHHRNIITPTFTTGKMKQLIYSIEDCTNDFMTYLRKHSDEPIDFAECLGSFALDVIATSAFGTKIDCLNEPDNDFVKHSNAVFTSHPIMFFFMFLFPPLAKYMPSFIPLDTISFFRNLVSNVVDARQKQTNFRKDFLQIMLEAKAEYGKGNLTTADGHAIIASEKYPLTQDHIVAQSILFIVAGFETTATTLSYTLYNLVLNEDVQEKVITEIDDVLAKNNGKLNYELISELHYMDMVIAETLRMYPPVVRLERECNEDFECEGLKVDKGETIGIPIYCIHYDEEYYPDPEKFDPERFSPENKSKRNPYVYLPFGSGPRNCIGMRFAQMEMKIALSNILKEFRVKTCSKTDIPCVRKTNTSFLRPERMILKLEKRRDAH